jgi:hypothetical protein
MAERDDCLQPDSSDWWMENEGAVPPHYVGLGIPRTLYFRWIPSGFIN